MVERVVFDRDVEVHVDEAAATAADRLPAVGEVGGQAAVGRDRQANVAALGDLSLTEVVVPEVVPAPVHVVHVVFVDRHGGLADRPSPRGIGHVDVVRVEVAARHLAVLHRMAVAVHQDPGAIAVVVQVVGAIPAAPVELHVRHRHVSRAAVHPEEVGRRAGVVVVDVVSRLEHPARRGKGEPAELNACAGQFDRADAGDDHPAGRGHVVGVAGDDHGGIGLRLGVVHRAGDRVHHAPPRAPLEKHAVTGPQGLEARPGAIDAGVELDRRLDIKLPPGRGRGGEVQAHCSRRHCHRHALRVGRVGICYRDERRAGEGERVALDHRRGGRPAGGGRRQDHPGFQPLECGGDAATVFGSGAPCHRRFAGGPLDREIDPLSGSGRHPCSTRLTAPWIAPDRSF